MKTANKLKSNMSVKSKNAHLISIDNIYSMFECRYNKDFYFEGECHTPWELVYVVEGRVGITADNKIYSLGAGDIIFHKPMEFHKIWCENSCDARFFVCSFDIAGKLSYRLRNGVFHLCDESLAIMNIFLNYIRARITQPDTYYFHFDYASLVKDNEIIMQRAIKYLELVFMSLSYDSTYLPHGELNDRMRLYTEIVEILEQHVYEKITISQIAEMCNASPATIKNCFTQYAGCGIHKYFLNIKMRTAIELLKCGNNVSEVSDMLGFANPNYFSYVFTRETGTKASEYKR